ncbi:unnamed protein product [Rotaria magnacalcarata]|uniref:Uncharacterized protein n=2 Tax=Rotaria magnacalcarata TaxID=392030 RepID=A0A8S2QTZ7_9BILA|nr:unnamed protein product [Rotaria magnacalcarata]
MALPPYAANNKYVINDARSDIKWRHGRPNYSKTIALYIQEKLAKHTPDSMEEIVENIVKNWEVGKNNAIENISELEPSELKLNVQHDLRKRLLLSRFL